MSPLVVLGMVIVAGVGLAADWFIGKLDEHESVRFDFGLIQFTMWAKNPGEGWKDQWLVRGVVLAVLLLLFAVEWTNRA